MQVVYSLLEVQRMKNTLRILTCFLGILAGCTNLSHTPPQIEEKTVAIYTKNAIAISELETSVIAS
jgi:hypothetical protein